MVNPYTRSYYASTPPNILAGRFGGGFAGAVQLGGVALAGSFDGPVTPTWLQSQPLNTWVEIAGTSGAGGASIDAYSGMTLRPDTSELFIALAGGHQDSSDNRVVSLRLTDNAPAWTLRNPSSTVFAEDVAYYPDGKPSSRHTYGHLHWSATKQRLVTLGARFVFGQPGEQQPTVDTFNPVTNTWDAAGTNPNAPAGWYGEVLDANGDGWSFLTPALGARKWTASTGAWSDPGVTVPTGWVRRPWVLDTLRGSLFGLCWKDNENQGSAPTAVNAVRHSGTTQTAITFNASAALTQFQTDQSYYAGMCYDADNDRFLWYSGQGAAAGRVYVITPNAGTVWDMSILSASGSLPGTPASGLNARIIYVPSLKGVVVLTKSADNLRFMRTA